MASTVYQALSGGIADLVPFALLREPELLGLLGGNVVCIDGLCTLGSIGDANLDPFRGFLLKMLRTRGQGVTLAHCSAQPEPFLTQKHPLNTPWHPINTPCTPLNAPPIDEKALTLSL